MPTNRFPAPTDSDPKDAAVKAYIDRSVQAAVDNRLPTGFKAATMPRQMGATNCPAQTSGTMFVSSLWLPAGTVVTSISKCTAPTAGVGQTNWFFALFDGPTPHEGGAARALLRQTADQLTAALAANTVITVPLTTPYTTVSDGLFYVGSSVAFATTGPTWVGVSLAQGILNALPPVQSGTADAGLTGTAPAAAASPTATGTDHWFAIS